jgi:hypothetical protein
MPENPVEILQKNPSAPVVLRSVDDVDRLWNLSLEEGTNLLWDAENYKIQPDNVLPILKLCGVHRRMKNGEYSRREYAPGRFETTYPSEMADLFKKTIIKHLSFEDLKPRDIGVMIGDKGLTDWTTFTYAIPEDFPELAEKIIDNIPELQASGDRWGDETFVQATLSKASEEKNPEKRKYYLELLQKFNIDKLTMVVWSSVAAGSRLSPAPEERQQKVPELT